MALNQFDLLETDVFLKTIECMPDAVLVSDINGVIVMANQQAGRLFQCKKEEYLGKEIEIFIPEGLKDKHKIHRNQYSKNPAERTMAQRQILYASRQNGSTFPAHISLMPINTNGGLYVISSIRDMTSYQELQNELVKKERDLRSYAEGRLASAQEDLLKSEKFALIGGLVAGFTHELYTPIGTCLTATTYHQELLRTLEEKYKENSLQKSDLEHYVSQGSESMEITLLNLKRAIELVTSFKVVAVDQASEDKRVFDLNEYLQQIILSLRPKLKKTQHTITVNCPGKLILNSYPGAIAQIFSNLIDNSLIHGFSDIECGEIIITAQEKDECLTLTYEDNGCGISSEALGKIFEPFYTTRRAEGGSGLGLSVVYNLVVDVLGGEIVCQSEIGEGVMFTLSLNLNGKKEELAR